MLKILKIGGIIILVALSGLIIYKIAWINFTAGHYAEYGCCGYKYLTQSEIDTEEQASKERPCPLVVCKISNSPGFRVNMFFNNFDFNK